MINDGTENTLVKSNLNSFSDENIQLEFENFHYRVERRNLVIATTHTDILIVDKRAMYIMQQSRASAIDGKLARITR